MDALLRRRMMMAGGITPVPPGGNYRIFGSPTISGNSYSPDTSGRGFVYTNLPFDPGGNEWIIQTKIKYKTAVAWRDIISSVDADGNLQYSITCQTSNTKSNQEYGLYLSSNGTSWNVASNASRGVLPLGEWRVFQLVCTRSGNSYLYKMGYPDLDSWTNVFKRSSHPLFGKYISFGGGFSSIGIDADFDLAETKIWIDGQLFWEAVTA